MKRKLVIFGTGRGGRNAVAWTRRQGDLVGFLDNNQAMQGGTCCRRPVFKPDEITSRPDWDVVIASEVYYQEMDTQLRDLGVDESRIHFCPTSYINGSRDFPIDLLIWALGLSGLLVGAIYFAAR